jgi:hypothetical protein
MSPAKGDIPGLSAGLGRLLDSVMDVLDAVDVGCELAQARAIAGLADNLEIVREAIASHPGADKEYRRAMRRRS